MISRVGVVDIGGRGAAPIFGARERPSWLAVDIASWHREFLVGGIFSAEGQSWGFIYLLSLGLGPNGVLGILSPDQMVTAAHNFYGFGVCEICSERVFSREGGKETICRCAEFTLGYAKYEYSRIVGIYCGSVLKFERETGTSGELHAGKVEPNLSVCTCDD